METISDADIYQLREPYYAPKGLIMILFVTSSFERIKGVQKILTAWPNTSIAATLHRYTSHPINTICLSDIVLIDDELEGVHAPQDIAEMIRDRAYPGLIASIAPGKNPSSESFRYHFGRTTEVGVKMNATNNFIAWMNSLINEVELNYMR